MTAMTVMTLFSIGEENSIDIINDVLDYYYSMTWACEIDGGDNVTGRYCLTNYSKR